MFEPLRLAVVGCGWAGAQHARAAAAQSIAVTWAVDVDLVRAQGLSRWAPHAQATTDLDAVLRDGEVEALSLCLPHHLHAPFALRALQAGKHVLVEKPLAANLAEADTMIAAAARHKRTLMVAENICYDAAVRHIQTLLAQGVIGEPALIQRERHCYLRQSFLEQRPWFLDEHAAAGGIMMSGGIHDFELLRLLLGPVEAVMALRAPQRFSEMQGDDTSTAQVRFCSGATGLLVESFISKRLITAMGPEVHTLRIDGALGSLSWRAGGPIRLYSEHPDWRGAHAPSEHRLAVASGDTFAALLADFVAAIRLGRRPLAEAQGQRHALACVVAAYRSMQTGQWQAVAAA